ncbi:MAG: hypothetical protein QM803_20280 [Rhodocyclaceae bacterium]
MKRLSRIDGAKVRLWLEITWRREGLLPFLAVLAMVAGFFAWGVSVPRASHELAQVQARLSRTQTQPAEARPALPPAQAFQARLSDPEKTSQALRRIFALAAEHGVSVSQADYRRVVNRNANGSRLPVAQLQIALPVRGQYAAIKRFSLGILTDVPSLSIDQMTLKRQFATSNVVDGQLYLSIWERTPENAP